MPKSISERRKPLQRENSKHLVNRLSVCIYPLRNCLRLAGGAPTVLQLEEAIMGYQFMHIEAFGRKGAHKKNSSVRKYSMFDICAEMIRDPHACSHVRVPLTPEIIFGMKPQQAFALVDERAAQAVDKKGRKLRSDAVVVLVGVASWPETVGNIGNDPDKNIFIGEHQPSRFLPTSRS